MAATGPTRKRGAKAIAPEDVPSSEVRSDLLDNEVSFDVSPKPDPAGEQRNILVAKSPAERAIVALNSTKAETQLRDLVTKSADIVAVNSVDGREQAHRIAMTLKTTRVAIEKTGKAAREDAQAFSKAVITEENRLIAIISDEEKRVFKLRDEYDAEQARLKEEADRLARERVSAIRAKIDAVAHLPSTLGGADSARLVEELQKLVAMQPTAEEFDSLLAEMLLTIETVGSALSVLLDGARKREESERQRIADQEAERAKLAAQAEENARIAAELERKRLETEAAAKAQADELSRLRAEMERERAELEALREAMKPKPAPADDVPPNTASVTLTSPENPAGVTITWPLTDADHAPQFDWNTPADQLDAIAITPPAVEPAIDFAALDEPEPDDATAIDILRDAVRSLRYTRSSEFVSAVVLETLEQIEGE